VLQAWCYKHKHTLQSFKNTILSRNLALQKMQIFGIVTITYTCT